MKHNVIFTNETEYPPSAWPHELVNMRAGLSTPFYKHVVLRVACMFFQLLTRLGIMWVKIYRCKRKSYSYFKFEVVD